MDSHSSRPGADGVIQGPVGIKWLKSLGTAQLRSVAASMEG